MVVTISATPCMDYGGGDCKRYSMHGLVVVTISATPCMDYGGGDYKRYSMHGLWW